MIDKDYLKHSEFINCNNKHVKEQARLLSSKCSCDFEIAKSYDYKLSGLMMFLSTKQDIAMPKATCFHLPTIYDITNCEDGKLGC